MKNKFLILSLTVSMAGLSAISPRATYAAQSSVAAQTAHAEGVKQFKQKKYAEAVTNFRRAIKFSPEFAEAWTDLANTYLATRDLVNAEEAFVNANRLQPANMAVAYNLAYVLRKLEKYDRAIKAYGAYISKKPDDADAQYGLAEALRANQENLRAAAAYRRYASLEKRKDRAKWRQKTLALAKELETSGSKKSMAEAPPASARPTKTKVSVEAPPKAQTAKKPESPTKQDPVSTRDANQKLKNGLTALKAKNFDLAIRSLTEASAQLSNPDASFFAALGSAYLGKRDSAAAVESYKRALSLLDKRGADFASVAQISIEFGLAEAYRLSENNKMAAELYRKVLSSDKSPSQLQVAAKRHLESLSS